MNAEPVNKVGVYAFPASLVVKKSLMIALRAPLFNALLVALLGPLKRLIPEHLLHRIPIRGTVQIPLPGQGIFYMHSGGTDQIAAILHWSGPDHFEGETLRVIQALLPQTRTFLDIGANTGWFAMVAAREDPRRQVVAFEPLPNVADRLRHNVRINGLDNIQIVQAAVTDHNGSITLYVPDGTFLSTSASTREEFISDLNKTVGRSLSVPACTLDAFVREYCPHGVDLMKIDTESTEPQVLDGAQETLERHAPVMVCEVLPGQTEEALHARLDGRGWSYYHLTDRGAVHEKILRGDVTLRHLNHLFVPASRHQMVKDALARAGIPLLDTPP